MEFSPTRLDTGAVEPCSGEGWSPTADFSACASLFLEIVVGRPAISLVVAAGGPSVPAGIPEFVSWMIEDGRSPESRHVLSFVGIVELLKENRFQILTDVDSEEMVASVS
jgi:hypothetical protein